MARPSEYSEAIAADICSRLASGEPLVRMCRDEHMPGTSTVYRWLVADEKFRDMYARAREDQADTLADQIIDIADEDPASVFTTEGGGEDAVDVQRVDGSAVAHQRLRVDARKWVAAKLKPRKYGDRQEIVGPGGESLFAPLVADREALRSKIRG